MKLYNHLDHALSIAVDGHGSISVPAHGLSKTLHVRAIPTGKLRLMLSKYQIKFDGQAEAIYLRYNKIYYREYKGEAEATPATSQPEPAQTPKQEQVVTTTSQITEFETKETAETTECPCNESNAVESHLNDTMTALNIDYQPTIIDLDE